MLNKKICVPLSMHVAFQEWVFEEAADLPGLYTIANKYTVSSDSVTPLYITAEPNPTSRTAVHLSPKISDPTGQFSLRQLWRFVPVIGRKNSSYVQNYQSSGYVFDIENFDTTHPITLIPPIDSAAQRYAVDPTFGPTSSIQASIEQLETED